MSVGASENQWRQTASIQAIIANQNRKKGSRAFTADDFDPYAQARRRDAQRLTPEKLMSLKPLFKKEDVEG